MRKAKLLPTSRLNLLSRFRRIEAGRIKERREDVRHGEEDTDENVRKLP